MDGETNLPATISLGSAITLALLWVIGMCVGLIPIIGLVTVVLYPINWLLALTAMITGFLGYRRAQELDGLGQAPALIGGVLGALWTALQLLAWTAMCALVIVAMLAENL
ncbi:MAG: hypothetical protein EP330_10640 [Deltaproteobacteria bacterium]|nr:MAG: hypothetical protein EP330_10640 [Deltaproteobacteria bacterium]